LFYKSSLTLKRHAELAKTQAQQTEIEYKLTIFVVVALLTKPKQQHGKNQNKNTGLFINCMGFVVGRTKLQKSKLPEFGMTKALKLDPSLQNNKH
jgi:hypothetical protein